MTYYGGKELAASFRTVRNNTIKVAEDIPEDNYTFRPAPDSRTVAQLLTHIALGPSFAYHVHSNKISDLKTVNFADLMQQIGAEDAKVRDKAELLTFLRAEGERFATFLEGLTDTFLAERVAMAPGAQPDTKSRLEMLLGAKEHEMHHRGQLMLVERMIGVVPHLTRERMAQAQAAAAR